MTQPDDQTTPEPPMVISAGDALDLAAMTLVLVRLIMLSYAEAANGRLMANVWAGRGLMATATALEADALTLIRRLGGDTASEPAGNPRTGE